jgi:hypothetical protein
LNNETLTSTGCMDGTYQRFLETLKITL